MILLENISKSYPLEEGGRRQVFNNLSLVIPPGVNVGMLGANGAGKSTLLRLIGGSEVPDRGRVTGISKVSPPFGLASGISTAMTGRDNVKFASRINGDNTQAMSERIARVEAFAEIGEYFLQPVRTYSSGMRARLAFAISMAFDYEYYLMDELTAVGDRAFRMKAEAAFKEKRGRACVILASHSAKQLLAECEAGIYVGNGTAAYFPSIRDAIKIYHANES